MKPTLLILAAGMGSRYGGLKQLDGVGTHGETIMDYSVYDAIQAGFGKIVFVIRHSFEADFREQVIKKYEDKIPVSIVFQEIDSIPEGYTYNPERTKPWGTNHAILMGKDAINEPFGVINADDFYGRESFNTLHSFLKNLASEKGKYCMVGFQVGNTLSESGAVSRGVCTADEMGFLTSIVERTKIVRAGGKVQYADEEGKEHVLADTTPVSMNMWGFTPDYFDYSLEMFKEFLSEKGQELRSEYYIPTAVNHLMVSGIASVKLLETPEKWFGVTYAEDRPKVVEKLAELIENGVYPSPLF